MGMRMVVGVIVGSVIPSPPAPTLIPAAPGQVVGSSEAFLSRCLKSVSLKAPDSSHLLFNLHSGH